LKPRILRLIALTLILLIAAALRFAELAPMRGMLHHDEAAYGVDALSLIAQPRLPIYFPANNGREGLWIALIAPLIAVFGGGAFPMRVTAMLVGVLTVAAVYALARETQQGFQRRDRSFAAHIFPIFVAAALAVQFWHVLHSHHAFRAITFPSFGALALALCLRAHRLNERGWWMAAGVVVGLLFYTYIAARLWLIGIGALASLTFVRYADRRRGVALGALLCGMVCAPLVIALIQTPQMRVDQVAITSLETLIGNLSAWIGVLFANDPIYDNVHYLDGAGLWTIPTAFLALSGVIVRVRRDRRALLGVAALLALSILPAALTDRPITLLRALGATIPLALIVGYGAAAWWRVGMVGRIVVIGALVWGATATRIDLAAYVDSDAIRTPMEQPLNAAIDALAIHTSDMPVYFTPLRADHPVLQLRAWTINRPFAAFLPEHCTRLSDAPYADYVMLFPTDALDAWGRIEQRAPSIMRLYPEQAVFAWDGIAFDGQIAARFRDPIPTAARAGEAILWRWMFRRIARLDRHLTAFLHLYEADAPILRAQHDMPLCPVDTPMDWRADEVIAQTFALTIPPDLPAGSYRIAFGLYESALDGGTAGARLRPRAADGAFTLESKAVIVQPSFRVEGTP
jgi:hypothetical protein